jgi:Cu/Ag efflux protein CusF
LKAQGIKISMRFSTIPLSLALASIGALAPAHVAQAQKQAAPTRIVGSVTAVSGQSITIKPDTGASVTITVSDAARILETQPGAKTLAGATPIQLSGIAIGDRVLAAVSPGTDGSTLTATTLIAMKQAAVAEHQQAEEADWQRRGVGGLVKSIDATAGTVTIASGARILTIHATPKTIVRRYSADSIKFTDTQPSTLAQIQPGDQLRARGDRSADGTTVTADEIVAGTFRNIAGTVLSIDSAANTVTVKDLATKKPVIIRVTAESQMHKLPEQMAQALAMRLKRSGDGQAEAHPASETGTTPAGHAGWQQSGGGQRSGDLSQMLQRTPPVQLSELHKGDAVMIVATQGTPDSATAVTLLAGVEPILTASPAASQSMFSASWNVGGGADAATGEEGTP